MGESPLQTRSHPTGQQSAAPQLLPLTPPVWSQAAL